MAKEVLDDKVKQAIDTYSERIETLKDFVTAVRKLPGMYVAGKGNLGFKNMIREVAQNAIDQLILLISPCDHVILYYNEKTLEVSVEDNGLGLPFDSMERILTAHHTSGNYTKKAGEYTSGRHGSGLKAVNGLSSRCIVESYHYSGKAMRLETIEGYPTKKPYSIPNKEKKQGTKVTFFPCLAVLEDEGEKINLPWNVIYIMLKHIMSLTPIGSKLTIIADDIHGVRHEEFIENKDGIITELIAKIKNPIIKPIVFGYDNGTMKLDCALCYDSGADDGPDSDEYILSFCNMTPTEDNANSTHAKGVLEGVSSWFVSYMNNIYLSNQKAKDKTTVTKADIKCGLNIIIAAAHLEPTFGGQAKDSVTNADLKPFCKQVVLNGLDEWSKANPQDLTKLSKYLKDIADIRQKTESERVKVVSKYTESVFSSLPSKYKPPVDDENLELMIVEGDSAGGTAKTAKAKNQGIFPIRGKTLNVFNNSKQKILNNAEVQGILDIVFNPKKMKVKYKKNFDPYKDVKWVKIVFMADADVDRVNCPKMLFV